MEDILGDVFAVYSDWVIQKIKVSIVTDFVYECPEDAYVARPRLYTLLNTRHHVQRCLVPTGRDSGGPVSAGD